MAEHTCAPMKPYCCCSMIADEPSWDCPIHGGAIINRCACGRFVRLRFYGSSASVDAVDPQVDSTGNLSTREKE